VLFLDEEIASRAPKCGKRRRAEGKRKLKRPKTEGRQPSSSSTTAGVADVIVVGGGGAAEEEDEDPELDSNLDAHRYNHSDQHPDLDPAMGASTLKLQYSTVRLYSSAIINLYAQQKTRGENPAPHPNGLAKKALMRHILRETASRSRQEWADRILNTIKDGYSPSKIPEHTAVAWRFSDVNSGFRTNVDFLFGNHMLLRSSNRLGLELADCFCLDLPKEGIKMEAAGGVPTKAFVVLMNQGKTNQHGRVEYGSCLRHRNPEACLVGQLAFWFFFRWQAETHAAEPFPDFSRPGLWYRTKVVRRGKADYTGQLSYATAHKWALDFYGMCGIHTGKATHAPRVAAAQNADMAGVSDAQVSKPYD
jgi:hypothetical protein